MQTDNFAGSIPKDFVDAEGENVICILFSPSKTLDEIEFMKK
jgi:hypothetical protein